MTKQDKEFKRVMQCVLMLVIFGACIIWGTYEQAKREPAAFTEEVTRYL